jgi:hypothetical protein
MPVPVACVLSFEEEKHMLNRFNFVLTAALLIGWAGTSAQAQRGFGFPGGGFGPGMGKVVTGEPYTAAATSTSLEKLANGTTISHSSTIAEARDAEGRTYRSVTTPPSGSSTGVTRTTVFDPVAHTITEWSTLSTTATQIQLPANPPGNRGNWTGPAAGGQGPGGPGPRGNRNEQIVRTTLSPQSIAGVNATGVKTVITIPTGAQGNDQPLISTREVWTAPDLKIVLLEKSDSPRDGSHKTEVTSLTPGTPDSALFQVPQGYTVKTQTRHRGN